MLKSELALGDLTRGYEHLASGSPTQRAVDWSRTTVVLDTNVLLSLYRSPDTTRDELLSALGEIRTSLFMPAQVQAEFWRHRDNVLRENKRFDETVTELRRTLSAARGHLRTFGHGKMGPASAAEHVATLESAYKKVIDEVSLTKSDFDWRIALANAGQDTVLSALLALYKGKVGLAYDQEEFALAVGEGKERASLEIPPGYRDGAKNAYPEGGTGDYLLWRQTLTYARVRRAAVVLVTQDGKEDWWRLDARSEPINARYELVEEMKREAGVPFDLLDSEDFVRLLADTTQASVSERTIETVGDMASVAATAGAQQWTRPMLQALIQRLAENGYPDRVTVLLAAVRKSDGVISRAEVLRLLGRSPDSKLTGFTRSITTATKQLISEEILPPVGEPALQPNMTVRARPLVSKFRDCR